MLFPATIWALGSVFTLSPTRSSIEPLGALMKPCGTASGVPSTNRTEPEASRFRSSPEIAELCRTVKRIVKGVWPWLPNAWINTTCALPEVWVA